MKTKKIWLPNGFTESIKERSGISAAVSNANQALRYVKECKKYHKETGQDHWIEGGLNYLLPYYKKLLSVEHLANKYSFLWLEKYSKAKLQCEKALGI